MNEQELSNQFLLFFPGFSSTSLIPFPATLTHHLPEKRQLVANIQCLGRWTPLKRLFEVTLAHASMQLGMGSDEQSA
ncbi:MULTISPECIES: hypothetical protein [Rhizobium]|uniref:Uncharacterized protein n=1 Tax=Rhizobium etli TaxID=29449 RepID=A0A7W6YCT3_RHIET|nr:MULTISPECIES: hypothetical protein [Rhizobium]MBB4483267.1 hypothetical protein [Rhizobium etli]MBB4539096.1 hypothetical protein [Rhizobium etli]PDT07469.1 hypothetical protein CO655_27185 [Rhizobium sp. M1]